jgi:hypothetical protein
MLQQLAGSGPIRQDVFWWRRATKPFFAGRCVDWESAWPFVETLRYGIPAVMDGRSW